MPVGVLKGGGHDVLGFAVQPVCQGTRPRGPPRCEELVAASTQQHGLGAQRLVEQDLGRRVAPPVAYAAEPAAMPEALVTARVLDDSVDRDVLTDDDPSHCRSLLR